MRNDINYLVSCNRVKAFVFSETMWCYAMTELARFLRIALLALIGCSGMAMSQIRPSFGDYVAPPYQERLIIPSRYWKDGDGWRDEFGKQIENPHVNMAGRFFVAVHSCGSSCRYYTLSDLSSGNDTSALDRFASDGPQLASVKQERRIVTDLITRSNSYLFIARYHVEPKLTHAEECHERFFSLNPDGKKAVSVSRLFATCSN